MSQKYEDPPEVFRGHLDECLRHLGGLFDAKYPKNAKGARKAKQPMADFCGVQTKTVVLWLAGEKPVGLPLIKLVCYLQLLGYKILEYSRIKQARRRFAELIAFGLLAPEEACDLTGYATSAQIFSILKGQSEASEQKDQLMMDAWLARRAALEQKKLAARDAYRLDVALKTLANGEAVCSAAASAIDCLSALFDGGAAEKILEATDAAARKQFAGRAQSLSERLSTLAFALIAERGGS
jgi:hypothetical protein